MIDRCGWTRAPTASDDSGQGHCIGATWIDLGQFEPARKALLAAVQAEDREGTVPIHDIERLANVEARLGERQATAGAIHFDGKNLMRKPAHGRVGLGMARSFHAKRTSFGFCTSSDQTITFFPFISA